MNEEIKKYIFDKIKTKTKQIFSSSPIPSVSMNSQLKKVVDEIIKDSYYADDININISGDRENKVINTQLTFKNPSPALKNALEDIKNNQSS